MGEVERARYAFIILKILSFSCPKWHRVVFQRDMRTPVASHVKKFSRSHVVEEKYFGRLVVGALRGDSRLEVLIGVSHEVVYASVSSA